MEDDRVGHRENEQHLYRWETHLPLATDVVTDEVTRAKQQLPHTIQNRARTRTQTPNVHHALAHTVPPYTTQTCPLRTRWAIVTREGETAVVAAVLILTLNVLHRLALSTPETRVLFFYRLPTHPILIVNQPLKLESTTDSSAKV